MSSAVSGVWLGLSILFNICCTLFRLQNLQEDSEDSTENQSPEENKVTEEDKIKTAVEEETKSDQ